jgi:hypothetical protein
MTMQSPTHSPIATPFAIIILTMFVFPPGLNGQTYHAGADMKAAEIESGSKKNPVGPWSYGQRSTYEDKDLTLLKIHQDSLSDDANFPGWVGESNDEKTGLGIRVNMGGEPETIGFVWGSPGGPFLGDGTPDIALHPADGNREESYAVVRWTAPASGTYRIEASWRDISRGGQNGSEGADVHLVVKGVSVFDGVVSLEADSASAETTHEARLSRGDVVDFVVGPNAFADTSQGSGDNDGTALNASITLVPKRMP